MNSKTIIVFVLTAGMVAAALVYDGVAHRHTGNSAQAISQSPVATPPAAEAPNASNAQADAQADVQSKAPAADAAPTAEPGQDAVSGDTSGDASQAQTDADVPAAAAAQPIVVPAGTTLTVRLGEQLGSRISEANQSFSATLDRDVVVDGQTVIAAGANVTGKVAFARPAGALAGEANLQLKVTSVNVNNTDLPVVTSIRSFGPQIKGKNKVGKFMKGLAKRAVGDEREVLLAQQSAYSFTLRRGLQIE
jgi:hypothetical protein